MFKDWYVVECKWPNNAFYEQIAAFNCKEAADAYAVSCAKGKSKVNFSYRVVLYKA